MKDIGQPNNDQRRPNDARVLTNKEVRRQVGRPIGRDEIRHRETKSEEQPENPIARALNAQLTPDNSKVRHRETKSEEQPENPIARALNAQLTPDNSKVRHRETKSEGLAALFPVVKRQGEVLQNMQFMQEKQRNILQAMILDRLGNSQSESERPIGRLQEMLRLQDRQSMILRDILQTNPRSDKLQEMQLTQDRQIYILRDMLQERPSEGLQEMLRLQEMQRSMLQEMQSERPESRQIPRKEVETDN